MLFTVILLGLMAIVGNEIFSYICLLIIGLRVCLWIAKNVSL